ncbi:MAG: metallophosphoesterase [Mesorhizobium sp.]|uniref:metallophosphoesterase n=1 Tax=Mesorhizobium sp. TaxID=1871066 RepID=UPI000FE64F69|nr:metallophosphoesterase [Mesorhizobium sp.]RWL85661.1 MAG: metallophosphoesterase [Mesorhizobium sp.]
MRLWIWSDLHLEVQNVAFPERAPEADAIVCAGDLCLANAFGDHAQGLIERYEMPMIFVPGNHEFYSPGKFPRTKPADHLVMKEVAEASRSWRHRLYLLDDDVIEFGGVRFIGGTLWTDFRMGLKDEADLPRRMLSAPSQLADFSLIRLGDGTRLTPQVMLGFHHLTRGFIERRLAVPFVGKTVVVTHHLPHPDCTPAVYRGLETNYLFACGKEAFEEILNSETAPALWVCGHTHHASDLHVGRTRIVCNPHGYLRVRSEWNNGFGGDLVIDTENLP